MPLRLLVLGSSARGFDNWLPGIDALERQAAEIEFLAFPRLYDLDSVRVTELLKNRRATIHPYYNERKEEILKADQYRTIMQDKCKKFSPDIVLLTTCHIVPEAALLQSVQDMDGRPIVVGLQHGFYQAWENYTDFGPCFDYFFCFGELFFRHFPEKMRLIVRAAGLPKLDAFQPAEGTREDILFLAQANYAPDILRSLLRDIRDRTGMKVRIRPHPELRNHYEALSDEFVFDQPQTSLMESMAKADRAIAETTTAVLEFFCLQKPIAILPAANDFDFREFGLVADGLTADAVEAVWNRCRYDETLISNFLKAASGSATRNASALFAQTVSALAKTA